MIVRYEIVKHSRWFVVYAIDHNEIEHVSAFVHQDDKLEVLMMEFYKVLAEIGNHPIVMREG